MLIVPLDEAVPPPNQIDKDWLTAVLKRDGTLSAGGIRDVQVDYLTSTNSHIARIRIEYDADTEEDAPRSLILKTVEADAGFIQRSEVDYYTRDYLGLADAPIPKCYAAQVNDNGSYSILMEDLSSTHERDSPPSLKYGLAVATAVARLHAFGWGEQRIHQLGGRIPDESNLDQYVGHVRRGLDSLLEATSLDISDSWRQTVLDIFRYHPRKMFERTKDPIGFTIVHGDVNPGNILCPIKNRERARIRHAHGAAGKRIDANIEGKVYFLDRQPFNWSLTTWLGVSDLSYLMVQYWDVEVRRELEMSVLREYHDQLLANGISGYGWDQLFADYKLCAVQAVYTVAEWCIKAGDRERMRWLWRLELERAMHAFFDLGCAP
jgi:Phosphotransferase enzyme family